jgi:type I restriction enzyme M protein
MFVQSADFVQRHHKTATDEISVYGVEKDQTTANLNKMNLAVHGLTGDVRVANTYYDRPRDLFPEVYRDGGFDFVMANPPFNVSGVDKERLEGDERFPFGLPKTDNANYIWIQQFHAALRETGRAGFVMANSAGDARGSELLIRQQLIKSGAVDVIVSIGSNFFYTVTLPCTLWFLDRGKANDDRGDKVLFLDARHIFHQVDRAHRDFTPQQIEFLTNIVRLYRGEEPELANGSDELLAAYGLGEDYADVIGLCKVATRKDIEAQGWSLNPGRYVGAAEREDDGVDFTERLMELSEELEVLNAEAQELEGRIAENVLLALDSTT